MAFIYEHYTNNSWGGDDPGVKTLMGIKNAGTSNAIIDSVYINNIISNWQEDTSYLNFCIHLKDYNYDDVTIVENTDHIIPYPSYYTYKPGMETYPNNGLLLQLKKNFKTRRSFILEPNQTWYFYLAFNPAYRNIDFYRAELVVRHSIQTSLYFTKVINIKANYTNSAREIDGMSIPEVVMEVNGVQASNIFLIQ